MIVNQRAKKWVYWIGSLFRVEDRGKPGKGDKGTIAALDGVRAIAALLVVTLHLNEATGLPWNLNQNGLPTALAVFGRTGVDLFFVLSGFLLFLPYAKALLFQGNWPSPRTFYLRRMFRIWPGYYFSLLLILFWYQRQYLQPDHWKQLALFLTFFMDSSPQTWQKLNGPFWTLATEWQFYLILPLIAFCFLQIVKRSQVAAPRHRLQVVLGCCGVLILLALAMRGFGVYCQRNPTWTFLVPRQVLNFVLFFTFGIQGKYLEVFALGMTVSLCYTYAQHVQIGAAFKALLQRWSMWIWRVGFLLLICLTPWQLVATDYRNLRMNPFTGFTFLHPLIPYYAWLGEPLAGVGYALCVLAILFGSSGLRWFFELPYMRWIGQISYGLYMWNQKFLSEFSLRVFHHLPAGGGVLLHSVTIWAGVFVILLPLCALFYRFIEKPGILLGNWLLNRKPGITSPVKQAHGQLQIEGAPEQ
jgi:peptidoglycan/LPS O-acetylase OafA/YrhL